MRSLGELVVSPPAQGRWELSSFPEIVTIDGREFHKARWRQAYPGVVEQYREAVVQNSRHLKVLEDGTWLIDHADEFNPDLGHPVPHFFEDHPVGKAASFAGGVLVVGGASFFALSALFSSALGRGALAVLGVVAIAKTARSGNPVG